MMMNYSVDVRRNNSSYSLIPPPPQHHSAAAASSSSSSSTSFHQITTTPPTRYVPTLTMVASSFYLPKDDDSNPRGEDAHFICLNQQTIGVADGVGGWAATNTGISGGDYARDLMANSVHSVTHQFQHRAAVDPATVLNEAYSYTRVQGSSTACIISLQGNLLRAVNVGDSGFMLFRDGKVVYRSPTQQRGFNCPYQLGTTRDSPSSGQEMEVEVRSGDVVIAGTDGLFDNMHTWELEEMVNRAVAAGISSQGMVLEQMACHIANLALYNSFDRFADTPYAIAARKAGRKHKGGKVDDITVVVAYIR